MPSADEPNKQPDEDLGPYRIADETPTTARPPDRVAPTPDLTDSEDRDPSDATGREIDADADEESEGDGSLPPPISRPTNPKPWLVIGGVCAALLFISWLAGAPQLSLPDANGYAVELSFGERLNGLARTIVFLPLATVAAAFGLCALAFLRQRPIGDPAALFAKSFAIVCLATMTWLVPCNIRLLKQALHVVGMPAFAAALAVPIFRLHPRDSVLATVCALLGMMLLVFGAWVVVWSTG
jgi:hypothetical protein